jgi:hypothetical protein
MRGPSWFKGSRQGDSTGPGGRFQIGACSGASCANREGMAPNSLTGHCNSARRSCLSSALAPRPRQSGPRAGAPGIYSAKWGALRTFSSNGHPTSGRWPGFHHGACGTLYTTLAVFPGFVGVAPHLLWSSMPPRGQPGRFFGPQVRESPKPGQAAVAFGVSLAGPAALAGVLVNDFQILRFLWLGAFVVYQVSGFSGSGARLKTPVVYHASDSSGFGVCLDAFVYHAHGASWLSTLGGVLCV